MDGLGTVRIGWGGHLAAALTWLDRLHQTKIAVKTRKTGKPGLVAITKVISLLNTAIR